MNFLVTLLSLMAMSSAVFASDAQSHSCKSIIRVKSPQFPENKEVAYVGPYFTKNQRSVGFLDQEAYNGVRFFYTTLVNPNGSSIALRIHSAEAIGDVNNVIMLRYTNREEPGIFPPELNIYQLIVFCSNSEIAIENKISEYAKGQFLVVKPTSDLIKR